MNNLIKAKSDFAKIELNYKEFGKGVDKATRSAINSVAAQGKTKASKVIRGTYNIKAKDVNKTLKVIRISSARHTIDGGLSPAQIICRGSKALSLGKFKPTQTKKGAKVKVKIKGTKKLIGGSFKGTMSTGHQGVFKRFGAKRYAESGSHKGEMRQRIKDIFTIGVPIMFRTKAVMPKVQGFIKEKFPIILKSKLEYFNK